MPLEIESIVTNINVGGSDSEVRGKEFPLLRGVNNEVSLKDFFARPRLAATLDIATTGGITFPAFSTWANLSAVADFLDKWALFRGDLIVDVVYTGSPQMIGMLRLNAQPQVANNNYGGVGAVATPSYSYVTRATEFPISSNLPHWDMDLSTMTSVKVKLPFPSPYEYIAVPSGLDWIVTLSVMNGPLMVTGLTVPTAMVNIFVHYENVKLDVLVPQGESSVSSFSEMIAYWKRLAKDSSFPPKPISTVMKMASSVAEEMGYGRMPSEPQEARVVRTHGNPSLMSGQPDFAYTLASNPAVMRSYPDTTLFGDPGEETLEVIMSKPTHVARDWASGFAASLQVQPNVYIPDVNDGMFTNMGFIANMFRYWSGSIKVKIVVHSSPLLRWRILINVVPPGVTLPVTAVTDGSMLAHLVEINGTTEFEFEVPYMFGQSMVGTSMIPINSSATTYPRIIYHSLMVPIGPAATPVYPLINVYYSKGKDLSLGVPEMENLSLVKAQGFGVKGVSMFGETFSTVTDLAKRLSIVGDYTTTALHGTIPVAFPVPDVANSASTNCGISENYFSFMSYIGTAYFGVTGSFRFMLLTNSADFPEGYILTSDYETRNRINALTKGVLSTNGSVPFSQLISPVSEVRIPDRNFLLFRHGAYTAAGVAANSTIEYLVVCSDSILPTYEITVFTGAGDDINYFGYLGPPKFRLV